MRRYETIFILRSDLGENQVKDSIKRFEGLVATGGGEMLETDEWGFRELAYRIHNERRGYYVRLDYAASGPVMNEVERNLKLSDSVLRYLSVLLDPEVDTAKVRAEIDARLHRAAEAKAAAEARMAAAAATAEHPAGEVRPSAPIADLTPEEAAGEAEVAQKAVSEQPEEAISDAEAESNPAGEPKQN
ncbi:MAG TPA: 30S ribosomal protein S6 [Candidatus Binataceae bacterium]|nr:30S ribosomal protein S6 [Candidatus Binataceae bacterium]